MAGIDAGGLTKEMYTLFATELVVPEKCMLFRACEAPGESPCFLPAADFDGDLTMYAPVRLGARFFSLAADSCPKPYTVLLVVWVDSAILDYLWFAGTKVSASCLRRFCWMACQSACHSRPH